MDWGGAGEGNQRGEGFSERATLGDAVTFTEGEQQIRNK